MPQTGSSTAVSAGTRQKKRLRLSESEDEDADELTSLNATQSHKYRFDDGNMILHVQDTLFRVHRGVLSHHSTEFDIMFPTVHQPPGLAGSSKKNDATIEGCQVAVLQEDEVEDWERILAVIYDLDTTYKLKEGFSLEMVGSMLILGKKYYFDGIYKAAMERLRQILPTNEARWTGVPDELWSPNTPLHQVFKLISILLDIGNQTLLPALYYICAAYPKGTCAIFDISTTSGLPELLCQKLVTGREGIMAASLELHFTWVFTPPNVGCTNQISCQSVKQEYLRQFLLKPRPVIALRTRNWLSKNIPRPGVCKVCKEDIVAAHDASRKAMWDKLPSFFNLPEWKDLKDLDQL